MSGEGFHALGLDVGGTKIAAGMVSFPEGKVSGRRIIPTYPERGGKPVLRDAFRLSAGLIEQSVKDGAKAEAIGVGLCELVGAGGRILSANCVRWQDQPFHEEFSKLAPITLEADVRAAAIAEAFFGAGREFGAFVYVTVGTGISSCLMQEGCPYLGARGLTGTMASSPLPGRKESLEDISSGSGLVARYRKLHGGVAQSGQEILTLAAAGNSGAADVVRTAGEFLGASVGQLVNTLDPEAIVMGGGLGLARGLYWDSFLASARKHIWSEAHRDLPIVQASTGSDAGIIGAAAAAWMKSKKFARSQAATRRHKTPPR